MRTLRIPMIVMAGALVAAGCQSPAGRSEATSTPSGPVSTSAENGIADLPAEQIAAAAVTGLTHNYPMRLHGRMVGDDGKQILTLDIVRNFADGKGAVQFDGFTVELLRIGGHDYVKADAQFWTSYGPPGLRASAAAARADAKWVRANLYSSELPVGVFLDLHEKVWEGLVNDKAITKGGRSIVNGVPTIAIKSENVGTVYVATQGEPNVIRVESPDGSTLDYSEHSKAVVIEEPPTDKIVDLEAAKGAGS